MAGPTAGQILADLGAEVLKIKAVNGGDQARGTPGSAGAAFHFFNRNKGSLALDLKGRGREVFLRLACDADIIVDNFAYGAVDGLGRELPAELAVLAAALSYACAGVYGRRFARRGVPPLTTVLPV